MRKILLPFISLLIIGSAGLSNISAQNRDDIRIAPKLSASIFLGIINPAVEFKATQHTTFQIEALGIFQPEGFLGSDSPCSLGASWFEYRYFIKESFRGFFAGVNAGWGVYRLSKGILPFYKGSYGDSYQVGQNIMLGITIGYHLSLSKHWGLEASIGGGYQLSKYEGFRNDGTQYIGLNKSAEWIPYKAALNIVYKF